MNKESMSTGLLSRAANVAASKARFAGRAKEIAGTRNVMSALRGKPNMVLKRGENLLAKVESKAGRQANKFQAALASRTPLQKAASITGLFDELEKIGGLGERLLIRAMENPTPIIGRILAADDRSKRPNLVNALQEGYPASWVSLGMRPHPRE